MSYTVTNTFATQSGNVPASQLDTNFTNVLSGVNNAYLVGTLAARPAPNGVGNGRYYFATDSNGGTLYRDNGSAWVAVAAGVTLSGAQFANQSANLILAGPSSGAAAAPTFRSLVAGDFANQSANLILAGPSSGAAAAPTFRALVQADLGAIVGTGQLKSSTGSVSGSIGNGGTVEVAMNDYSFFPNANIASGSTNTQVDFILANTSTLSTVGTFALYNNSGVGTNYTVNWRYITATDNPIVYLLLSGSTILGVWAADDPPPDGVTGLNVPQGVMGQRIVPVTPAMLDVSAAPASAVSAAQDWITQQGYKMQNINYRIVQQWANGRCDAAPAQWMFQHGTWDAASQILRVA